MQRTLPARSCPHPPCAVQHFHVPDVVPELSSERVLASEWVPGVHIDKVGRGGAGWCRGGGGGDATRGWQLASRAGCVVVFCELCSGAPGCECPLARLHACVCAPRLSPRPLACATQVAAMPQAVRDEVGTKLLKLTLKELFHWRYMQTDPNWVRPPSPPFPPGLAPLSWPRPAGVPRCQGRHRAGWARWEVATRSPCPPPPLHPSTPPTPQGNFLYHAATGRINLIDFGAARDYPLHFVTDYLHMVRACAERDRQQVVERSTRLGFLTGEKAGGQAGTCTAASPPQPPLALRQAHVLHSGATHAAVCAPATAAMCPAADAAQHRPPLYLLAAAGDESAVMLDAHVEAGVMVGLPFGHPGVYDFGAHGGMTRRVSELGAVMLKHRLTPVRCRQGRAGQGRAGRVCWPVVYDAALRVPVSAAGRVAQFLPALPGLPACLPLNLVCAFACSPRTSPTRCTGS